VAAASSLLPVKAARPGDAVWLHSPLAAQPELLLASVCSVAQPPPRLPGDEGFVTPAGWSGTDLDSFTITSILFPQRGKVAKQLLLWKECLR